jgi:AcrR family transcriptional regulator
VGLRESKKERTREDLVGAAISLFTARGYDQTTVEDIAAAAHVSPRTFFRYFPAKEDVVVGLLRAGLVDLREELLRRPPGEPLADALHAATRGWAQLTEQRAQNLLQMTRVIHAAPALRVRLEAERRQKLTGLTAVVAERLGADAETDPRPRLAVAMLMQVIGDAIERWSAAGGGTDLAGYLDAGFDLLRHGLPG